MLFDEPLREIGYPDTRYRGGRKSDGVVSLEAPSRVDRDYLLASHKLPSFSALHESLMAGKILRCLGRSMSLNIVGTRNKLPVDRSDASRDQIRILKIAEPYGTVVAFCNKIYDLVTVTGLYL
ncbi:hypothetical protein EV131_13126 [Rhizobium laguerreae]|uniref:Uncharacterized protein n=1 Tax=Rhizobium laguerreae TaxID=1076926 RepID=A0AAX2QAK3_9HYPH|nr:hypothetical protein EV131_13126 [Rhizobium laguerreae]